jgi:sarcosine oxidase subunit alpha
MDDAVARECLAVRARCGIFDASTLGKIEVVGPDAAEFLNRLYVNSWSNLAPGVRATASCCVRMASSTTMA